MGNTLHAVGRLMLAVVAALSFQGCDFFRTLAGRPTSRDLQVIEEMRSAELRQKAELEMIRKADSLDRVMLQNRWKEDSAAVSRAMASGKAVFKRIDELRVAPDPVPDSRFCLMMGYFNNRSNAERLYNTIKEDGFEPVFITFSGGATGVALFPCDTAAQMLADLELVRGRKYFPSDFWIIWNTNKYDINNSN